MRQPTHSRRRWTRGGVALAAAALVVGLVPAPAQAQGVILNAGHPEAVPGSYIVVLEGSAVRDRPVSAHANDLVARYGGRIGFVYDAAINGFSVTMSETAARRLAAHPSVAYVEQDLRVRAHAVQVDPPSWGLDRIDQRTLPLDSVYEYPTTASTVNIYILDTGVRLTHTDFGGRAFTGFDAVTPGGPATDCNGHGTHVAGIAAGTLHGVAKGARIHSVRVLGCLGSGTVSQAVAGVNWVTLNAVRPAVANMSFNGPGSATLDGAVTKSIASGVVYTVAGDNVDPSPCTHSPARVPEAITVGASGSDDRAAAFLSFQICVDLFAPGASIRSTWHTSDSATAVMSGTSAAAPHVAGAAAMVLALRPTWTPSQVTTLIMSTATPNVLTPIAPQPPNFLLYVGDIGQLAL